MRLQRTIRQLFASVGGATAVEFAFVAPLMLAFLLGMVELGRLFLIHNAITFATEEAARAAMVRSSPTVSELQALAQNYATALDPDLITIAVTTQPITDGKSTTIVFTYQFRLMTNFFGLGQFAMERRATVNRRNSF